VKKVRSSEVARKTTETDVKININIDGSGIYEVSTGIGFFDHMLKLFSKHGLFNLKVIAVGDLYVDAHHTVEDVGIVLGNAMKNALGEKNGIKRYASSFIPMDEALVLCAVDLSGRPYLVFDTSGVTSKACEFDFELAEEFFRAVAFGIGINLHIKVMYGRNMHHILEGMFKAFGKALSLAVEIDSRIDGVMSTKGSL
jgi:imidazoleglycerol-phosphate dehydratase